MVMLNLLCELCVLCGKKQNHEQSPKTKRSIIMVIVMNDEERKYKKTTNDFKELFSNIKNDKWLT